MIAEREFPTVSEPAACAVISGCVTRRIARWITEIKRLELPDSTYHVLNASNQDVCRCKAVRATRVLGVEFGEKVSRFAIIGRIEVKDFRTALVLLYTVFSEALDVCSTHPFGPS